MRRVRVLPVLLVLAGIVAFVGGSAAGAGAIAHKPKPTASRRAATTSSR